MLKILSRDNPSATAANLIPDPWQLSTPASETQVPQTWPILPAPQPRIGGGESPEALISGAAANPEQFILQDWLKLQSEPSQKLARQIEEILGWLYWMDYSVA